MAITIITSPNDWQNVYNEIVFNVSSSQSTQPNFQFLCDINIQGQSNPVSRLTYPKQPSSGVVNMDISNVVKDYVTYDIVSFNVSGLINNPNSRVNYWIEFGEIYDNVSGVPVVYPNLAQYGTSGSPKRGSNAIFDFLDWSKTAFNTGKLLTTSNKVSLNQNLFIPSIRANQQAWLSFFDFYGTIKITDIEVFNFQNSRIFNNTYRYASGVSGIISSNVGFEFLEFMNASGYLTNPLAAYYVVTFKDDLQNITFSQRINIDQKCTNYDVYRLHWLNSLGGFDSFNFTKVSKTSNDINRKEFKRLQSLNYAKTERLKTNYFTQTSEQIEINTDLLTNEEWEGLLQLVLSPVVIMEVDKDNYIPVNILETNYSQNKVINEQRPTSLRLTIQYTFDNYRQAQ